MARYAHIENGVVENIILADVGYDGVPGQFIPDDSTIGAGWTFANGQFSAPPIVSISPPTEYYISKVFFERRLPDAIFETFDSWLITVKNRPADWSSSTDEPWNSKRALVRPTLDYINATNINVCDPMFPPMLASFGVDEATATAILSPYAAPGEQP